MRVLKFGGTSMGSEENIRRIRQIAHGLEEQGRMIIVVSALGGITNALEQIGREAVMSSDGYVEILQKVRTRHNEMVEGLIVDPVLKQKLKDRVDKTISDLNSICVGVSLTEELTDKTRARLMSAGELLSSRILTAFLKNEGLSAKWIDTRTLIETDDNFLNAKVDLKKSVKQLQTLTDEEEQYLVMPGFIARTALGATSTLGRGGSDYTAALIAAAIGASSLEIWTDVDGVMTANPKIVPNAMPISEMSYEEAMELSYFGAKVIYPPTIQPALEKNIPIQIRNTFNPDLPGTRICLEPASGDTPVRGFSSISEISLITISGSGMIGVPGTAMRLFRALSTHELNVLFITQSSSEHTITIGLFDKDAQRAKRAISMEFELELQIGRISPLAHEPGLTLIAAVGEQMRERVGIAGKLFSLLGENGVNIRAIAQGSTERNVSFVIQSTDAEKALNVLHEGFFLFDAKVIHLFCVGIGNVGATMLRQLAAQKKRLNEEFGVELRVAGLANSKYMVFCPEGCDLVPDLKGMLQQRGEPFDRDAYARRIIELNLRNSIFVDNTASAEISLLYEKLLAKSVHVVTSNKIGASSPYANFRQLKSLASTRNVKYLYETNVAAGLPVIKTMREMILTGDHIHRIQAVLSGSLNFIVNTMREKIPFSEAVRMAREQGLTEPDPSIDLSGKDVKRKILILAREAGLPMEMEDIDSEVIIPNEALDAQDWDDLYRQLKTYDQQMEELRSKADSEHQRLRFLAELSDGQARVGLQAIGSDHPAYALSGKDNIVLIYSDRYRDNPLVVRGAGAGPEVTASGVLSDIMYIANV